MQCDVSDCFANGLNDIRCIDRMLDIVVEDDGCLPNVCHNSFSVSGFTSVFLALL